MLGTLITEWDEGYKVCHASLFSSEASAETLARNLTSLMTHVGFDGWLVNIENKIEPAHLPFLKHFLRTLRNACEGQYTVSAWSSGTTVSLMARGS